MLFKLKKRENRNQITNKENNIWSNKSVAISCSTQKPMLKEFILRKAIGAICITFMENLSTENLPKIASLNLSNLKEVLLGLILETLCSKQSYKTN